MAKRNTINKKARGFTLIELMIVVSIITILAAVAVPAYQDSIRKSKRREVQSYMLEFAQFLERNFSEANSYLVTSAGSNITAASFSPSSDTTISSNYTITLPVLTATTFTVQAAPINAQTSDSCGTLTYTHTGAKGAGGSDCW